MNDKVRNNNALHQLCAEIAPHCTIETITPLGPDADLQDADGTEKAIGYGIPLRIVLRTAEGERRDLCLHTAKPDEFGHDRRSDRAANMLLSYDTFASIPKHTRAIDVGTVATSGKYISLRHSGEFYLITEFLRGHVYAEDIRRIAHHAQIGPHDEARTRALALLLAEIHSEKRAGSGLYRRTLRDLLGSGEGIFGLVDGYPDDVPMAPPDRLLSIERRCLEWRHRLKNLSGRLSRTHGDFHPFNILFDQDDTPILLDTSRGSLGDPADDVICLALNYVFFALESPNSWKTALGHLWRVFFKTYLDVTNDQGILAVIPPFLAWRALVMANPKWYPAIQPSTRDSLLGFVERMLDSTEFDPDEAERLFV